MSYEVIDSIIFTWATKHALHVYTIYRDEEIRSVDYVGSTGRKIELCIDAPDQSGNVQVHVWDYKKRRKDFQATATDLSQYLELAHDTAMEWLS